MKISKFYLINGKTDFQFPQKDKTDRNKYYIDNFQVIPSIKISKDLFEDAQEAYLQLLD